MGTSPRLNGTFSAATVTRGQTRMVTSTRPGLRHTRTLGTCLSATWQTSAACKSHDCDHDDDHDARDKNNCDLFELTLGTNAERQSQVRRIFGPSVGGLACARACQGNGNSD